MSKLMENTIRLVIGIKSIIILLSVISISFILADKCMIDNSGFPENESLSQNNNAKLFLMIACSFPLFLSIFIDGKELKNKILGNRWYALNLFIIIVYAFILLVHKQSLSVWACTVLTIGIILILVRMKPSINNQNNV